MAPPITPGVAPSAERTTLRASLARLVTLASAHPRVVLVLAAAAPFLPSAVQFVRRGIPDTLLTGDPATLEIRTLHAAHLTQLLGPYSRFRWSHPGPAFFYLALPLYEAFHRRGAALNLFALLVNLGSAVGIALSARKLRGAPFAFAVATLLAVYECVAAQFQLADEWNPLLPVLPLGLLSLLCVRLGLGSWRVLPLFLFLGSAVVQTHVGYFPVVIVLAALAPVFCAVRRFAGWRRLDKDAASVERRPSRPAPPRGQARARRWPLILAVAATTVVLVLVWLPVCIENATGHPGNLLRLYRFFTAPHPPEHPWGAVFAAVSGQLSVLPLALLKVFGCTLAPTPPLAVGIATGQVVLLAAALLTGLRRGDSVMTLLSCTVLGQIACALVCVHAIQGEIHWHLVVWISIVGLVAAAALLSWVAPTIARVFRRPPAGASLGLIAVATVGLCVRAEAKRVDVFIHPADETAEQLARGVHHYLVSEHVRPPVIRVATHDSWGTVAAVVLHLYHESIPIFVESDWVFLVGNQFRALSPEHPSLWIGDDPFCQSARARTELHLAATAGSLCAYFEPRR